MPIHDWSRVTAGVFHAFHNDWIVQLARNLNAGRLPDGYYALSEQRSGSTIPDILTLESVRDPLAEQGYELPLQEGHRGENEGGIALAEAPPKVSFVDVVSEAALMTLKQRRVAIRHATDDRIVALLEIVSPGNKDGKGPVSAFVEKAIGALQQSYHLLIADILPNPPAAAPSLHDRIWRSLHGSVGERDPEKPLTISSYRAARDITTYVERVAITDELPDMPLFFTPDRYVNVQLEATYRIAYEGVPLRWRRVIEA